jgi:hypothetical protein
VIYRADIASTNLTDDLLDIGFPVVSLRLSDAFPIHSRWTEAGCWWSRWIGEDLTSEPFARYLSRHMLAMCMQVIAVKTWNLSNLEGSAAGSDQFQFEKRASGS